MSTAWERDLRVGGLRRFAFAITLLNVLGHTWLGFEQAWLHPFVALVTAYSMECLLEWVDARAMRRDPAWRGASAVGFVDFLLSAHITGLAVSMLLYSNQTFLPVAFGTAVAIGSKRVFRLQVGGRSRHFLNPSNLGISCVLVCLPWVGIAPPYQFAENISGALDWILPGIIIVSGSFINWRFTGRLPLLAAWLGGFVLQAVARAYFFDVPLAPLLVPMTGFAFVLFTFYMVTDPATTPSVVSRQLFFGGAVAAVYGLLTSFHIVFGLFFALTIVCVLRGAGLALGLPSAAGEARLRVESEGGATSRRAA